MPDKYPLRPGTLSAILALALLLRMPGLDGRGPWLDERVSLNEAVGSFFRGPMQSNPFTPAQFWTENTLSNVVIVNQCSEGGLGLPYHFLLHFWIQWFGPGELAVRGLSLLLGLATVALTFLLGRSLLGPPGGSVAALFCAVHPVQVAMSQELRSYALATALCLLAAWLLVLIALEEAPPRSRWKAVVLGTALALAFVSHYAAASVVAAVLFFGLVLAVRQPALRGVLGGSFVLFSGCMLLWLLPLGLDGLRHFAAESAARRAAIAVGDPSWAWVHPPTPRYLLAGAAGALLTLLGSTLQSNVRVIVLLPFLAIFGVYLYHSWGATEREQRWAATIGSSTLAFGIGFAWLSALVNGHDAGLSGRYFAFHIPFAAVLFAGAILRLIQFSPRRWVPTAIVSLQVLLICASQPSVYHQFMRERHPNTYASIAQSIRELETKTALVTFPRWTDARTVSIYEGPQVNIAHRVLDRPGDEVILYDDRGKELRRIRIDRAHAR